MQYFKRDLLKNLNRWKKKANRKPLIIRGARQVGKTTLLHKFSNGYKHKILLNLEKLDDKKFFNSFDNIADLLDALFFKFNISNIEIENTLLFIDEIQESPEAISLLRYFYEEYPLLHVIAAGSLLEFALKQIKTFPVGRVEYLYLHPLNFAEYLKAINHSLAIEQLNTVRVKAFAHNILLEMFNRYAIIGGMPEIVNNYIKHNSMSDLSVLYESLWESFKNDVEKYASNQSERNVIRHIMSTAHLSIDKRIKFQNFGMSNYRSREVTEAMRNLEDAKIIRLIYPTTKTEMPLEPNLRKSPRIEFLDTGIVNYILGVQADMLGLKDLSPLYKGRLIPHLLTQEIISLNLTTNTKPNFWVREKNQSTAEVDLIYPHHNMLIPIEIKSGKSGTLKSLHQFVEQATHPYALRIYAGEFKVEKTQTPKGKPYLLMNLPYYLGTKISEYVEYFVNNFQLQKIT